MSADTVATAWRRQEAGENPARSRRCEPAARGLAESDTAPSRSPSS